MMRMTHKEKGFTMAELLVAMAIAGVVMAAVYSTYYSQQKSYVTQEQVAGMQQNLRAAIYIMERELRMAGYDPTGKADAGIVTANANSLTVTMDIDDAAGTGTPDEDTDDTSEDITYSLYTSGGIQKLGRKSPSTANNQPVAENIDALDFVYLNQNGQVTTTLSQIRSVEVSLVARTSRGDPGYLNNEVYQNQQGAPIYTADDNYRRKLLTVQVKCRNLGLD